MRVKAASRYLSPLMIDRPKVAAAAATLAIRALHSCAIDSQPRRHVDRQLAAGIGDRRVLLLPGSLEGVSRLDGRVLKSRQISAL